MKVTTNEMTVWKNASFISRLTAVDQGVGKQPASKVIGGLHGYTLRAAVRELGEFELLAFLSDETIRRSTRIAAVSSLENIDLLIAVATGNAQMSIRNDALRRIDELCGETPLGGDCIERLVPCLDEPDLIAFTVVLMDAGDYDWCVHCTADTVDALCAAMYAAKSIHETVILEDAFAYLAHSRPDLGENLRACNPDKFMAQAAYASVPMGNVLYVGSSRKANVA